MPHDSDEPGIRVPSPWKVRPGSLYGIRQSTLTGAFQIRIPPDFSFDALDRVVASTLVDTQHTPPTAPCPVTGLASRALQWMNALQAHYSIPVSGLYRVGPPAPLQDGWSEVHVAASAYDRNATQACFPWVVEAIKAVIAAPAESGPLPALDVKDLERALKPHSVGGTNMFHFLQAALQMDIPFNRIVSQIFSFGMGAHTRWLYSTITDHTPQLAVRIAHDKMLTAEVLRRGGLPAPVHMPVANQDAAVEAAAKLGYPVVVKPNDQEQGRGVAANLATADAVRAAFAGAAEVSKRVLVEKHFHGKDYRLTVVRGEVIKIENRVAGGVKGDGVSTIEALVEQAQATPRFRKMLRDAGKMLMSLDAEAIGLLDEAGLTPQSVPAPDHYVVLRRKNNVSTGGLQIRIDVGDAHPDNVSLAIRAAGLLRLDFAGIDLLIPDIAASWLETGALICEVNAQPQIGVRTTPDIYREVLADLMADGSRIPVHLVVATSGTAIAHATAVRGANELRCNGFSTSEGIWIDGSRIAAQPGSAFHAAAILLSEPAAQSALCIVSAKDVIENGLPTNSFRSIRVHGGDPTTDIHRSELAMLAPMLKPHAEQFYS